MASTRPRPRRPRRPRFLTAAVTMQSFQSLAGAAAAGLALYAVDDAGARYALAAACLTPAAVLLLCSVLMTTQRSRDWPRWAVITIEVPALVLALLGFVTGRPASLAGVAVCGLVLYALSDPGVINWFGPQPP
jgi:hypothetical protein